MSDPLSIAAAVIGIADASLKASVLLYKDVKAIIDAPQSIRALEEDIAAFNGSLESIKILQESQWKRLDGNVAEQTKAVLSKCEKSCITFRGHFARWTRHSHGGDLSKRDRFIIGTIKEKEILSVSQQLQNCKSTLTQAIALANLQSSIQNGSSTETMNDTLVSYMKDTAAVGAQLQGQIDTISNTIANFFLDEPEPGPEDSAEDITAFKTQMKEENSALVASQKLLEELMRKSDEEAKSRGVSVAQHNTFGHHNSGVQLGYSTGTVNNHATPYKS